MLPVNFKSGVFLLPIYRKFVQELYMFRLHEHVFRFVCSSISLRLRSLGTGSLGSVLTLLSPLSWSSIPQGANRTVPTLAEPFQGLSTRKTSLLLGLPTYLLPSHLISPSRFFSLGINCLNVAGIASQQE